MLERHLYTELNVSARSCRRYRAKAQAGCVRIWRAQIRLVKNIEEVRLQPYRNPLLRLELLPQRNVPELKRRSLNDANARIAPQRCGSRGERSCVEVALNRPVVQLHVSAEVVG